MFAPAPKVFMLIAALCVLFIGCKKSPTACFTPTATTIMEGESITFDNCSTDGITYLWTVSDGQEFTTEDLTIEFPNSGTYTVTLEAFSKNEKKSDEKSITIVVEAPPAPPVSVTINNLSVTAWPETDPATFLQWDFIDGADLIFTLVRGNTEILAGSSSHDNATSGSIYDWASDFPLMLLEMDDTYTINLYDSDATSDDDLMGSASFIPGNNMSGLPSTLVVAQGDVSFTLDLTWNY